MRALPAEERQRLGALLASHPQSEIMAHIAQFSAAEIHTAAAPPTPTSENIGAMVLNMERGTAHAELTDFIRDCPQVNPCDIILANELDDGCLRSSNVDVAAELARALGMHYVFGLEFIELRDPDDPKGFHGNAIFSRFPIVWAQTIRLPAQYNWYFDTQSRIGGRNAVLAKLDIGGGRHLGVASIHLENRTSPAGRALQMAAVLEAAQQAFRGLPVLLGGDLNTNTFDGRATAAAQALYDDASLQQVHMRTVAAFEPLLSLCEQAGYDYRSTADSTRSTRRKPMADGGDLLMRLDWLLLRGMSATACHTISTVRADCGWAREGTALARFTGKELTDHNAVWACCRLLGDP